MLMLQHMQLIALLSTIFTLTSKDVRHSLMHYEAALTCDSVVVPT